MKTTLARKLAGTLCAALLMALSLGTVAQAQTSGLMPLVEYDFSEKPADGKTVANLSESKFGSANVQGASVWDDNSLILTGGNKDTGNWVKLPEDLLAGQMSATIQTEVKVDASMLSNYHFLWNIGNDSSATEYLFAALACKNGRTPLVGIKANSVERLIQAKSCAVETDTWVSVATVIDGSTTPATASLYLDGNLVAQGESNAVPSDIKDQSLNTIARSPWPDTLFKGAVSNFRVFATPLTSESLTTLSEQDAQIHADAIRLSAQGLLESLGMEDQEVTSDYFSLPTLGGRVVWSSSDEETIALDGAVTRPAMGEPDKAVSMTATATIRGIQASRTITATVRAHDKSSQELLKETADTYVIPTILREGDQLPTNVKGASLAFTASAKLNVTESGRISIADDTPVEGKIHVTLTDNKNTDIKVERSFDVKVLPKDQSAQLLSYHREATSELYANNGDIAYSMHLALAGETEWMPLNGNYGVFFPRNYVSPKSGDDVLLGSHRSLKDPMLFNLRDGSFGVVAVRTNQGTSTQDSTGRTSILFATSEDLLSYNEEPDSQSIIDLGEINGVNAPYAVYDSERDVYLVGWKDNSGVPKYTTFADLKDSSSIHGEVKTGDIPKLGYVPEASEIEDYVPGFAVAISAAQRSKLEGRLGRTTNVGIVQPDDIELALSDEPTLADIHLPESVVLNYSDGSTAALPVEDWDLTEVDLRTPGRYSIEGKIKQVEYPLPFAEERADPSIKKWEWKHDGKTETKFLMIASNDIDGDVVWQKGTPHMPIRMADSIAELADTPGDPMGIISAQGFNPKESILLTAGDKMSDGTEMWASFWAPEIHEINGTLCILFMPGYSKTNWFDGAAAVMQLKKDDNGQDMDPTQAESWTAPEKVLRSDGGDLSITNSGNKGMSLDMSYFEDEQGNSYYIWQQLGAVYIAAMDPKDVTRLTSDPALIISPEYAWDNAIAEGPNVVNHEGKLYLLYSGSSVGKTYTTGLAVADASGNTNLLSPDSWEKLNYPIQKSDLYNGEWQLGTGHGMWSEDEDGQMIYVFHAYANWTEGYYNGGGRDAFVRRVHWRSDGMPILDMGLQEEVAPGTMARFNVIITDEDAGSGGETGSGGSGGNGGGTGTDPDTECEEQSCKETGGTGSELGLTEGHSNEKNSGTLAHSGASITAALTALFTFTVLGTTIFILRARRYK